MTEFLDNKLYPNTSLKRPTGVAYEIGKIIRKYGELISSENPIIMLNVLHLNLYIQPISWKGEQEPALLKTLAVYGYQNKVYPDNRFEQYNFWNAYTSEFVSVYQDIEDIDRIYDALKQYYEI